MPWKGVRSANLLDEAGVAAVCHPPAHRVFDGAYTESLTSTRPAATTCSWPTRCRTGRSTREHGGPVRLYVAPMYGYKSLKWLERIEVVNELDPGYWEERGYDVDAWIGKSNGRDDEPV